MIILAGLMVLFLMHLLAVLALMNHIAVQRLLPQTLWRALFNGGLGLPLYYFMIVIFFIGFLLLSTIPALAVVVQMIFRVAVLSASPRTIMIRIDTGLLGLPLQRLPVRGLHGRILHPPNSSGGRILHDCDFIEWYASDVYYARVGGDCYYTYSSSCGAFYTNMNDVATNIHWSIGAY